MHNFSFYELHPEFIEIRDLKPLEDRNIHSGRTGDYLFFQSLRARKSGFLSNLFSGKCSEIVLIGADDICYSEDLEHVILKGHSGPQIGSDYAIRSFPNHLASSEFSFLEGDIIFSCQINLVSPFKEPEAKKNLVEVSEPKPENSGGEIPEPEVKIFEVSDLDQYLPVSSSLPDKVKSTALSGCLLLFWNFLKLGILLLLILAMISWLGNRFRSGTEEGLAEKWGDNIEVDHPKLNPKQDTLAPMPWDYLTNHRIRWNDFGNFAYQASYKTSSLEFQKSQAVHVPFSRLRVSNPLNYWNAVYSEFFRTDQPKLDSLVDYFRSEKNKNDLNSTQTAEMVISFIQEIPYYLIHEGSCSIAIQSSDFVRDYHASGKPCLAGIIAGVQTPYEFLHNLKGDCDTRSLLGFSILARLGVPASIWVSQVYGHSVLGVGAGSAGKNYKFAGGVRHSAVELTAKGFRLGMISPEHGDMNNWEIALYKN